jgi:hypothetical protein
MIKQEFTLDNYDWHITVFYAVHGYYVSDIMAKLHEIGISTDVAKNAFECLSENKVNTGLTYVNNGKAVCIIGYSSSAAEYANSIQHEIMHLAIFISRAEGIELDSEEVCYIGGEIAQKMHPKTKLLTSHCGCYTERIERKLYEK